MRWRHLACAAQALPDALARALELGGWRAVPDDEHDELRAMIEHELQARRTPVRPLVSASVPEPKAARSSSAMAAAAVLEPAQEAETLTAEQARAWVFADALQAAGDFRGELLALELAAELTDDPIRARALQREHRTCARAHEPPLAAGAALRLRWVGGFLLAGYPKDSHELHRLLASPAAATLTRIRLDFCTREDLARLVGVARAHRRPLTIVDLPHARASDLQALSLLDGLRAVRVGDRFDPSLLGEAADLRSLAVVGVAALDVAALAPVARTLERLELRQIGALGLAGLGLAGLGRRLPRLHALTLAGWTGALDELLRGASSLRTLQLLDAPTRALAPLTELPELRELALVPGKLHVVHELARLTALERLALAGSKVGELEPLAGLRACEHLALSATPATRLDPLAQMPSLRSLILESGDMRRLGELPRLHRLEQLTLSKLANLDLDGLQGFDQLHTLVLDPGGRRPRGLERLADLPGLRRVSAPIELLDQLDPLPRGSEALARVEVLELTGDGLPTVAQLRGLPHLRRLLLPQRDPRAAAALVEALPEVTVFTDVAPRDRLDRRDPFDWRTGTWPEPGLLRG